MTATGNRLRDLAVFVRSKNAGPFMLTIDLFFDGAAVCQRVVDAGKLTPARIGSIYHIDAATIKVIHVAPANALKISFPRPLAAGDVVKITASGIGELSNHCVIV